MLEPFEGQYPKIHPDAFVHESAVVIGDVTVGAESSLWPNTSLRGDDGAIVIGERTSIQDGSTVHTTVGRSITVVGSRVTVGHGAILHGCRIEDDCLIGMGSILLDNAVVERGAIVGAGALVSAGRRVPAGMLVMGQPFKVVRACTPDDAEWIAFSWRTYVERLHQYKAARAG